MRKLVLILLIACLVFGGVMGYLRAQSSQPAAPAETPVPETAEPAAAETPKNDLRRCPKPASESRWPPSASCWRTTAPVPI